MNIIISLLIVSNLFVLFLYFKPKKQFPSMMEYIKNFESYTVLLEFYKKRAYDIIYKDHIMIYSIEATKIDDKEFNEAAKSFALLVMKMLGQNLVREYSFFYGDENNFIFNLVEFFNDKYENDEIRKQSLDNISQQDINTNQDSIEDNKE